MSASAPPEPTYYKTAVCRTGSLHPILVRLRNEKIDSDTDPDTDLDPESTSFRLPSFVHWPPSSRPRKELVSDLANTGNELRMLGVGFEILAQAGNKGVHCPGLHRAFDLPDVFQKFFA